MSCCDSERLLARFLRYVTIDTTADRQSSTYPSSAGQWELGRVVVDEMRQLALEDIEQDRWGLVWATVPATVAGNAPVIALNAHFDTSPETSGSGVKPQLIRNYSGGDLVLRGDERKVIRESENSTLLALHGKTIITTDGTTLLGADDKAGIAVIMEMAAWLQSHPEIPHGRLRILLTCDEEIGHGVRHVDLRKLGAQAAYTLDGGGAGEIDVETFSADQATVTAEGVNIHPSIAKGRMVNAVRAISEFITRLPRATAAPESTAERLGFLHPFEIRGGVAQAAVDLLIRDFDTARLTDWAELLRQIAGQVEREFPGASLQVRITPQYRNLADGLAREPRAVAFAEQAHRRLNVPCKRTIIRGGTDGSQLTAMGLPTPNLSTGQHNPHSPLEWACLEEMEQAVAVLLELAQIWALNPPTA